MQPIVPFAALLALAFPVLVIAAALKDITSFTIPNWIPLGLLAVFPAAAVAAGMSLPAIGLHAGVGLAGFVVAMGMFAMGWMGGGDAKLFAACLLWLGWPAAGPFLMISMTAGGILALGLVTLRSAQLRPLVLLGPPWFARLAEPGEGVPYGLALAAGALAAFAQSPFMSGSPLA